MPRSDDRKKPAPRGRTLAETYRSIRKPMPPPEKVQKDRRIEKLDQQRRREAEQETEQETE
jgi:hypothetical protein